MNILHITALLLFAGISFLFWKLTRKHFKNEYGKNNWNLWKTRLFYWQGTLAVGAAGTCVIRYLLQGSQVLNF